MFIPQNMHSFVELKGDVLEQPCVRSVLNCTSGGATVMFWAYLQQYSSLFESDTLSIYYNEAEGKHIGVDFYLESGVMYQYISILTPNQWNHVAVTAKYSNPPALRSYLYGGLYDYYDDVSGSGYLGASNDKVYVGKLNGMGTDLIDELLYFPEVLSDQNIQDIYDYYGFTGHIPVGE